jgi:hypothetical protein
MIICDKCKDQSKTAEYASLAMVTHDRRSDDLLSLEYNCDLCEECYRKQQQAIEQALGMKFTDVSPQE